MLNAKQCEAAMISQCPTILRWEPGTKYGTTGGRFYGIQNGRLWRTKESSSRFYKVLNDDVLIDKYRTNILLRIVKIQRQDLRASRVCVIPKCFIVQETC
jgi:hypothetical protein